MPSTWQSTSTTSWTFQGYPDQDGGRCERGAALSVKAVTDKPIKFIGVGEKLDALEPFFPERLASRILGMGI